MSKIKILVFNFSIIIILLSIIEILSFALVNNTTLLDRHFFHKHQFNNIRNEQDFEKYLIQRNESTGWPTKNFEKLNLSKNFARRSPANEKFKNESCFAIYGDSFAYDADLSNENAWTNQLAELMECSIFNYGIPGFGIDQAYLRFKDKNPDNLNAIMTFIEGDYRRARTKMYSLQSGEGINLYLSKKKFEIDKKRQLSLSDLPVNSYEDFQKLENKEFFNKIFSNDLFLPNGDLWSMSDKPKFPYSIEIFALVNKLIKRQISYGAYLHFHPTYKFFEVFNLNNFLQNFAEILPSYRDATITLNEKILENFISDCKNLDIQCFILPLPIIRDFGKLEEGSISKSLKKNQALANFLIIIKDECLIKEYEKYNIMKKDIRNQLAPGSHYNSITSKIIAECVFQELEILD